jgi:hypothetical protein
MEWYENECSAPLSLKESPNIGNSPAMNKEEECEKKANAVSYQAKGKEWVYKTYQIGSMRYD